MSGDPLAIPDFLRRARNPAVVPSALRTPERTWIMPPIALAAVARAVRVGCDTIGRVRKRTRGQYTDQQLRDALHALARNGEIRRDGRRYISTRAAVAKTSGGNGLGAG